MGKNKKNRKAGIEAWRTAKRKEDQLAREDSDRIRLILEKDPDWLLVTGKKKLITGEDYRRERRGLTRLTKQAAGLLYPQFKAQTRYGRGTAYHWVHVNIVAPKSKNDGPGSRDLPQDSEIIQRIEKMLVALGLNYGTYLPDCIPGKDTYTPCLSIEVNGWW